MSRPTRQDRINQFNETIRELEYLKYTLNSTIYWDNLVCMPKAAIEYRSGLMGFLASEQYRKVGDSQFQKTVIYLEGTRSKNSKILNKTLDQLKRNYEYVAKIPREKYREYRRLLAVSEQAWERGRTENNYAIVAPYLEKIFNFYKEFAECWGYINEPYDALLGYYEAGLTTEKLDNSIEKLKPFLLKTLRTVESVSQGDHSGELGDTHSLKIGEQLDLSKQILKDMGFDFQKGRIDIGTHPTILATGPTDVRIINSYKEEDWLHGMYNLLHSCGKGIYQQNIDASLVGTLLAEPPSFTIEEAIGRLYENIIGRSAGYWKYFQKSLAEKHSKLSDVDPGAMYMITNRISRSAIRLEADELTFLIHIMIRYEIERGLINGEISIDDLQDVWNSKYEEYLGVSPATDSEGILQDIHWAAGYIGYFPTHFLGNMMASQLAATISKEIGYIEKVIEEEHIDKLVKWLSEKVFSQGAILDNDEIMLKATGSELSVDYLISYLRDKYSRVYNINL